MKCCNYLTLLILLCLVGTANAQSLNDEKIKRLKAEAIVEIEKQYTLGQQINDMLFSFAELGFQEVETSTYLTSILEKMDS